MRNLKLFTLLIILFSLNIVSATEPASGVESVSPWVFKVEPKEVEFYAADRCSKFPLTDLSITSEFWAVYEDRVENFEATKSDLNLTFEEYLLSECKDEKLSMTDAILGSLMVRKYEGQEIPHSVKLCPYLKSMGLPIPERADANTDDLLKVISAIYLQLKLQRQQTIPLRN